MYYVGIILDNTFKWNHHINALTNTIRRKLFYVMLEIYLICK